jgi:deltex-like protein
MDSKTRNIIRPLQYNFQSMMHEVGNQESKEQCIICLEEFVENENNIIRMGDCVGHYFHDICISNCRQNKNFVKCPICNKIYGVMIGDMPKGQMNIMKVKGRLQGINSDFYYQIDYYVEGISVGGVFYQGTQRTAYIPGNDEGGQMLSLLVIAFQRGLTFRIGASNTTGVNGVIWNIHHKTELYGGQYSFPDPTYFERLKDELKARGVDF